MRRRDLSTARRSIRALVVGMLRTALATNARARARRSSAVRQAHRPAWPPGRLGNEGFEADHVERGDETTQRFGDRIVVLTHPSEQMALQIALEVAPARLYRVERVVSHVYSQG
jgi:hypothetical protein